MSRDTRASRVEGKRGGVASGLNLAWTRFQNRARLLPASPRMAKPIDDWAEEGRHRRGKPRVLPGTDHLAVEEEPQGHRELLQIVAFYGATRLGLIALMLASTLWPENGGPIRSVQHTDNRFGSVVMSNPGFLRGFGNWDANHLLQVAGAGYGHDSSLPAFFPLYPLLLHVLSLGRPTMLIAVGLVVSLVLSGAAIVQFARLVALDHPTLIWPACVIMLLYPGALFLSLPYSESLALLTLVSAAYAARKRRWWVAGVLGGLAAATRPTGLAIIGLLVIEYFGQGARRLRDLPALLLPLGGPAAYSLYLWRTVGDPLAFIHAQAGWQRAVGDLGLIFTPGHATLVSVVPWLFAFLLALLSIRLIRTSYGVFASALLMANPLTGTFGSTTRYAVLAWPIFILGARYVRGYRILLTVSVLLSLGLAFFALLFMHGYWVA